MCMQQDEAMTFVSNGSKFYRLISISTPVTHIFVYIYIYDRHLSRSCTLSKSVNIITVDESYI